jgi:uncharacterized membrane protein YphA (DoxX/SURF4 family)
VKKISFPDFCVGGIICIMAVYIVHSFREDYSNMDAYLSAAFGTIVLAIFCLVWNLFTKEK